MVNQVDLVGGGGQENMSPEQLHTRTRHSAEAEKKKEKTVNKNTLANTDTRITQAFNRLFVQVKVDCRPLRKKDVMGAWECKGTRGTDRDRDMMDGFHPLIFKIRPAVAVRLCVLCRSILSK